MHGQTECLGNMLSLCANSLFPNNAKISLGFSTCLIMSYQRIPSRDLVQSCAFEHGISFEDLNACVSEEGKGLDLLEASIKRSEEVGVKKSCTVSAHLGTHPWFRPARRLSQALRGLHEPLLQPRHVASKKPC